MASPSGKNSLAELFNQAYAYLYKGLHEPAFAPARQAFESWLPESWKGGLAMRNRRLPIDLLKNVQWIPGKAAANKLGISMTHLRYLIHEGELEGQ